MKKIIVSIEIYVLFTLGSGSGSGSGSVSKPDGSESTSEGG